MTVTGWVQIVAVVGVLTGVTPLLGGYMGQTIAIGPVASQASEPSAPTPPPS
jgi:hypothetical protein